MSLQDLGSIEQLLNLSDDELSLILMSLGENDIEELLRITEKFRNDYENRFDYYQPTVVAVEFHKSTADIRALFGSNRSSKSYTSTADTISVALGRPPKSCESWWRKLKRTPTSCRAIGVDYKNGIDMTLLPLFLMIIPKIDFKCYEKESRIIRLNNGSVIDFMSYESEVSKFSGVSKDQIQFDEEPPLPIFDESKKRVISTSGKITFAMTAEKGINWTYDEVYLKADRVIETIPKEGKNQYTRDRKLVIRDSGDRNLIDCFRVSMYDNQHLTDEQIDKAIQLFPDEKKRRRAILGEFVHKTGLVYDEFNNNIHVLDHRKIVLDKDLPRFVSVDPGTRLPWAGLQACIDKNNTVYIEREMMGGPEPSQVYEKLDELLKTPQLNSDGVQFNPWFLFKIIDPQTNTQDPFNRQITILQELNRPPHSYGFRKSGKAKQLGISKVQEALHYDESKGIPPRLYIMDNCVNTIREITRYAWEDWSTRAGEQKNPKQTPVDKDDHYMECLYRLFIEPCFRFYDKSEYDMMSVEYVDSKPWVG